MIDQIIKKMTREVENCPESSFFGTGIILDVGVKRYSPPSDTELLRALHFRNTKNIRNPLIFLQKMASYSCFWRVPRSELFLQASLRQISNLLTLVSFHMLIYSTLFHCQSKVSWTRSFIFSPYSCIIIQHQ